MKRLIFLFLVVLFACVNPVEADLIQADAEILTWTQVQYSNGLFAHVEMYYNLRNTGNVRIDQCDIVFEVDCDTIVFNPPARVRDIPVGYDATQLAWIQVDGYDVRSIKIKRVICE